MEKGEYLSQLRKLLQISRHYGVDREELQSWISRMLELELGLLDWDRAISSLPKRLYSRIFRVVHYAYSEKLKTWSVIIEYGFGDRVEGLGKTPRLATERAFEELEIELEKDVSKNKKEVKSNV